MIDLTVPRRQSPLAIVFLGVKLLGQLGVVQVAVAAFFLVRGAADGRFLAVATLLVIALGVASLLAWWRSTFQLVDDELVVHRGVLRQDRLTVPVERIQSLAIDQELLHRATGLVRLTVDTAGSSQSEFRIDAIDRSVAEELQRQALRRRSTSAPIAPTAPTDPATVAAAPSTRADAPAGPERIVVRHPPRRLLVGALTMSPLAGLVVLAPLLALYSEFAEQSPDSAPEVDVGAFRWWWVAAGVVLVAVGVVVLNVVRVFLADWDLTLRAGDATLRRTAGLLSRTSQSSSITRVQVVTTRQNPLQRRAGIRDVSMSNAGGGNLRLLACDDGEVATTVGLVELEPVDPARLDRRIHPARVYLVVRNTTVVAAVVAAGGSLLVGWWSLVASVVVPVVWWRERRYVRTYRWALDDELATFARVITATTEQTRVLSTNSVRVTQSIFQRRRHLATIEVSTAAGTISVGMLPLAEAEAARDAVLYRVETDRRAFM